LRRLLRAGRPPPPRRFLMAAPTLLPPVITQPHLPPRVVDVLARLLAQRLSEQAVGHCLRVDNARRNDAARLADARYDLLPAGSTDVHVLADHPDQVDGALTIPAERAIELRNRKRRRLVLMVPVGSGSAASSLDNSFARVDIAVLLAEAGDELPRERGDTEVADGLRRAAR